MVRSAGWGHVGRNVSTLAPQIADVPDDRFDSPSKVVIAAVSQCAYVLLEEWIQVVGSEFPGIAGAVERHAAQSMGRTAMAAW